MKSITRMVLSFLVLGFIFFSCGTDENGNVVVIPDLTHILIISNTSSDNDWIINNFPEEMSGFEFESWSFVDSVPTVQQLNQFDAVLLFENGTEGAICDSVGDRMHDYVMSGGNVVLGTFYWQDRTDGDYGEVGWGDFESIDPIIADYGDAYFEDTIGTWIDHPLTRGLDSITCEYGGGYDSLRSGATAVAWWKNGEILMAYNKPSGRIVALTLWPAEPEQNPFYIYNGFYRAWENAMLYAAWGGTRAKETLVVSKSIMKTTGRSFEKNSPQNGGSR
ncbi:hypothetical protein F9K33_15110 [bacterium]|nr:MAG: hypothetical protein F9K33_15110 [bacterium]